MPRPRSSQRRRRDRQLNRAAGRERTSQAVVNCPRPRPLAGWWWRGNCFSDQSGIEDDNHVARPRNQPVGKHYVVAALQSSLHESLSLRFLLFFGRRGNDGASFRPLMAARHCRPLKNCRSEAPWQNVSHLIFAPHPNAHLNNRPRRFVYLRARRFQYSRGSINTQRAIRTNAKYISGIAMIWDRLFSDKQRGYSTKKSDVLNYNSLTLCILRNYQVNATSENYIRHVNQSAPISYGEGKNER